MEVTLIASTTLTRQREDDFSFPWETDRWLPVNDEDLMTHTEEPDHLAEFAGRACYQAWNRPNPKTATNQGYLANILAQTHYSVLEHSSATFYVTGVSRSLTHELVRHRHLSYSQLSQRYVDESQAEVVMPPQMDPVELHTLLRVQEFCREAYKELVASGLARGLSRKSARQMARSVLPNATETKIVVSGNMRAWMDMLLKRYHVAADAEIREFAKIILGHLRSIAPNTFQNMPDEPFS